MSKGIRVAISEMILQDILNENEKLKVENEQLREALRICDPWNLLADFDDESYYHCIFCKQSYDDGHSDDCEYIKLIGGEI